MKLTCKVEINDRSITTLNPNLRRRAKRSCLAIGKQSKNNDDLYLILQCPPNLCVKYKIDDNIDEIFSKFINDGRITIRIKQPSHDLIIQSDPIQLKSFLHALRLGAHKKINPSVFAVLNTTLKTLPDPPKIKLIVKNKSDYPTLQGFPKTIQELHLSGLGRKSFDPQILRLQSLRILNLSDNRISSLPKELGLLPCLQELNLSNNQLGQAIFFKWSWLIGDALSKNLRLLDISCNSLKSLPKQLGKLKGLMNLNVSENMLTSIPQSLGGLRKLKFLDLSKNSLTKLPGSIKNLRLLILDISDNAFDNDNNIEENHLGISSLVECAGKIVLKTRQFYNATVIPFMLVDYLNDAKYCVCGTACFDNYLRKSVHFNLSHISNVVKRSGNTTVVFDSYFCSRNCLLLYLI